MTIRRPGLADTDRRWYGVYNALVAETVADPEKEARVRLRYPWFDGAASVSDWVPVATPYAGNGYGLCLSPEKGDEVLVAFLHGCLENPVVLGGLFNGVDKPPTQRTADRDVKMIRTKAGHEIVLDDTSSSRAVRVATAGGHEIVLDDASGQVAIAGNGVLAVLADDGKITISGTDVTIQGRAVKVAGATVDVGAAAAQPAVLGSLLWDLFATHTHQTGPAPVQTTPPLNAASPPPLSKTVKVAP